MGIVSTAVTKFRTSILIMIFCVLAGILGRASMPIASNPNVTFPWVNVVVTLAELLQRIWQDLLQNLLKIDF